MAGLNTYGYVDGNPVKLRDPTGLIPPGWVENNLHQPSSNDQSCSSAGNESYWDRVLSGYYVNQYLDRLDILLMLSWSGDIDAIEEFGNEFSFSGATKGLNALSKSAQKGIRTLEKRIAEHEKKLADFKANPTVRPGMEGQPESVIKAAQESRIRHLEKEIQTFKENIAKLKGGQ